MKQLKNQRGLTLIELLAVIVILAIIAAIAAVAIGNVINNSKDKAILSDAISIIDGAKIAVMDDVYKVPAEGTLEIKGADNLKKLKPYLDLSDEKFSGLEAVNVTGGTTGETVYSITYIPLAEIRNDKYKPNGTKTASQPEILKALEGNGTGK